MKDYFYKLDFDTPNTVRPVPRSLSTQLSNQLLEETETHRDLASLKRVPPKGRLISTPYEPKRPTNNNATIAPTTSLHITPMLAGKRHFMRIYA
jgi:hypothetical protein